jgi:LiaF transmembrane domain
VNESIDVRQRRERPDCDRGKIVVGVVLVLLGLAFLAERQGWLGIDHAWRLWPLILVFIAIGKLSEGARGVQPAFSLLWIAGIFFLETFRVIPIRDSWPLFIVLAGISAIWKAVRPDDHEHRHASRAEKQS